jgi:hypothetical protein
MMCSSRHWFVATAAAGLQEGQGRRLLWRCPPAVPPPAGVQEEGQGRRGSGAVQEKGEAGGAREETCRGQRRRWPGQGANVWRLG